MAHIPINTWSMTASTWVPDFSPLVMAPPLPGADITLWPIIGKMADGFDINKYEWVEESNTQLTIACGEAMDTTETTWTMVTADCLAAGIRVGALIKNSTDKTKKEVIMVTAIDSATSPADLTVVRDYGGFVSGSGGGTTGETHTSGDEFEIIGYTNFQGSGALDGTNDLFAKRDRALKYNYYSIIDDFTRVTAEDLVRHYRGSSPDNWGYQLNGIKNRLDRIFERHLIGSPMVTGSASVRGTMGGLNWFATQTDGDHNVSTPEAFSYEVFDDAMKYLYNKGTLDGNPDLVCLMPATGVQVAAYIHEGAFQGDYSNETVRGLRCTRLKSTITGDSVPLIPCANIQSDSFMILNLNALRVHFLEGYALAVMNTAVGENLKMYQSSRLVSIPTLEFQRVTENCYYHTGVTYTRPS